MDKEIVDQLYKMYYRELYRYLFSLCKDHSLTEHLISDTFYKAILTVKGDEPHIKYWLFKVAKNLWLDSLKKRTVQLDSVEVIEYHTPLDDIIDQEKNDKLLNHMKKLPPQYKLVLEQFYFYDYSLKMIAKERGISLGAAKTMLHRSRKKLKDMLEGEGENEF